MKFLSLVLATVLSLSDAKRPLTNKDIQQKLKSGKFDKKALMAKAVPYNRKLQNDEVLSSDYSVKFNECISLKLKDNNLLDDNLVAYFRNGQLISEKSYVVFSMCQTDDCYYDESDSSNSWIVDVYTFVYSLASYLPNKKDTYCQQCVNNQDYCSGNYEANEQQAEEGEAEGEGQEEEGQEGEGQEGEGQEGGGRRLATYIDCDLCTTYQCFEDAETDDAADVDYVNWDDAFAYLAQLAACSQSDVMLDNYLPLYAGLICNENGNGVDVGVFLDDACTLYTTAEKYANIMGEEDSQYVDRASELLQYMFSTDVPCKADNTVYTNPYAEANDDGNDANEDDVGEWCENLFQNVQNLAECEAQENDDAQDANNDDMAESWEEVNWYSWDLDVADDDNEEAAKTCYVVQQWGGEYTSHHVYDKTASGTTFVVNNKTQSKKGKGAIITVVVLVVLVAAAGLFWAFQGKTKGDKKRTPLINGSMNAGSMA